MFKSWATAVNDDLKFNKSFTYQNQSDETFLFRPGYYGVKDAI
jgi:hypothetical protein